MNNTLKLPKITKSNNQTYDANDIKHLISQIKDKSQESIIKEAIQVGFLIFPNREYIWKQYENQVDYEPPKSKKSENDFSRIKFLKLSNVPIVELGDLFLCANLRILNLSSNYLMNIESLASCVNLIRLDLQNNQIIQLPNENFWSNMIHLRILFLHNNPIGKLDNFRFLSVCRRLEILTMYDSPISLKASYRHHAVNSILTLKALDNYAISDEEIIEGAEFANKAFSVKSPLLKIDLSIPSNIENSYKAELQATYFLMKRVNIILSHYSPVLIIQKYFRGFMARRVYKQTITRIFNVAAIRIQRWWRKIFRKKRRHLTSRTDLRSFSQKEISQIDAADESQNRKDSTSKLERGTTELIEKRNIIIDVKKLNKHEALKKILNEKVSIESVVENTNLIRSKSELDEFMLKLYFEKDKNANKNNFKLEQIDSVISSFNQRYQSAHLLRSLNNDLVINRIKSYLNENQTKLPKIDTKHRTQSTKSNEAEVKEKEKEADEEEDEEMNVYKSYRLPVLKSNKSILKNKNEFVKDMVKEKFYGYTGVKLMEAEAHKIMAEIKKDIKPVEKVDTLTNDQRFFQKIYGNMNLGSLKAVDKAFEERNLNDKKLFKKQVVESTRERKKFTNQQLDYLKDDRIKSIRSETNKNLETVKEAKVKHEKQLYEIKQQVSIEKDRRTLLKQLRKKDLMLAVDFSKQHLSVSKALQKHENLIHRENKLKQKTEFVSEERHKIVRQNELIKKFIQQRTLLRLAQTASDRKLIEERIKEEKEINELNARLRVEELKANEYIGENKEKILGDLLQHYQPLKVLKADFKLDNLNMEHDRTRTPDQLSFNQSEYLKAHL